MSSSRPPFILHATPPLGDLPASDAESVYLASLLQFSVPGRWAIRVGDYSANGGKLPFVTHLGHQITTRHLSNLPSWSDPDIELSDDQRADVLTWKAYIEQTLTDLVNHTIYSLPPNCPQLVAPAQLAHLGALERHYIPQRVRAIHKARLEHVGLWGLAGLNDGDAQDTDRQRLEDSFIVGPGGTKAPRAWSGWRSGRDAEQRRRQWGEEELAKRAKGTLDPLERLAARSSDAYLFGSSADLYLFAHLSLFLIPPYPNAVLATLIQTNYPALLAHTRHTQSLVFPNWKAVPRIPSPPAPTWSESISSLWSSLPGISSGTGDAKEKREKKEKSDAEKRFDRGRWAYFGGAAVAMISYLLVAGIVKVEFGSAEDFDEEEEEGEEIVIEVDDDEEDEDEEEDDVE